MTANRRAILLMLAFVLLWAGIEAMAANVLRHYSPYQVVWTRYAVHLALMLALWGWREPASLWQTRRPVFHVARSLLMLGMPASWVIGMQMGVPGHSVMTIFWISPVLILGLAWVFLQDRVPLLVWVRPSWPAWVACWSTACTGCRGRRCWSIPWAWPCVSASTW
ncbi:EamA family transporter [Hydrogenophaga sp. UC242_53]|uniref:EamA family transporter n=1 Tax=Hydrogenophaga sp. UC242_53 TaxID=3350170 RepID=UPI0036D362D1